MPSDERDSAEPGRGGRAEPALTAEIQRQVTELARRRHEPAVRHELLRQLADRRVAASRTPVVRFDYLPVDVGFDSLLVSGELLITQRSFTEAEPYLDALGLVQTGMDHRQIGCEEEDAAALADQVVVLTHQSRQRTAIPLGAQELADIGRNLRLRGFSAGVTAVVTSAPIVKGQGGPRPALQGQISPLTSKGPKVAI